MPPPVPPSVNEGRMTAGRPVVVEDLAGLLDRGREAALRDLEPDAGHRLLEELAVLAHLDRPAARADEADAEPVEDAALRELDREVERGLAADRGQEGVGPLALEDGLDRLRRQRLDVGAVGVLGVRHDRGRVRVDERDPDALLAEDLDRLGARVVELAGLADHDRPRADHEDGLDRRVPRHLPALPPRAHHLDELLEQVVAVVRPRARLGVVLHREHGPALHAEALDRAVVEVPVGQDELVRLEERRLDAEAVVLRGDLDLARSRGSSPGGSRPGGRTSACTSFRRRRGRGSGGRGRCRRPAGCRRSASRPRSRTCTARGRRGRSRGRCPPDRARAPPSAGVVAGTTVTSAAGGHEVAQDVLLHPEVVRDDRVRPLALAERLALGAPQHRDEGAGPVLALGVRVEATTAPCRSPRARGRGRPSIARRGPWPRARRGRGPPRR